MLSVQKYVSCCLKVKLKTKSVEITFCLQNFS